MSETRCKTKRVDGSIHDRIQGHITLEDHGHVTQCWITDYRKSIGGYGQMGIGRAMKYVHRVAYELYVGPVPQGLELDHLCRIPACVNPAHLEPVTGWENLQRSTNPIGSNHLKTHCPQGHEYDETNTRWYKNTRLCRTCNRDYVRRIREAKRAAA